MALGGARPGAGRPPGSRNKKTRERLELAAQEGITPLEVMLEAMRFHYFHDELDEAAAIAKDAAPYMHPRLATVNVGNKDDKPFQFETNARESFERRIAGVAANLEAAGTHTEPNGSAGV